MTDITIELKQTPGYPTAEEPRHRFDKLLDDAPWRDSVSATIYLDDPAWEILGYPTTLKAVISET